MPRPSAREIKRLVADRDSSRGLLIAFEGPDGSGKTTQRKLLKKWLDSRGATVVSTRWASSGLVKPLLKARKKVRAMSTEEYSLLHAIDFRHRVETVILPAMWAGQTVLADRFLFTALARDAARGLDLDWLLHIYSPLLWPDLVVYFSMSAEDSSRRLASSREPRYYEAGQDVTGIEDPLVSYERFINRVVTEYENLAVVFQFVTVDAGEAVYRQHTHVRSLVEKLQKRPWSTFSSEAVEEWLIRTRGAAGS
ncbi:MAG: dTMP kinase [Vicinamibacterales bacterium]